MRKNVRNFLETMDLYMSIEAEVGGDKLSIYKSFNSRLDTATTATILLLDLTDSEWKEVLKWKSERNADLNKWYFTI